MTNQNNQNSQGNNNQQRGNRPQNNQQNNQKRFETAPITDTVVDLKPISVGYNITENQIDEFLMSLLGQTYDIQAVRLQKFIQGETVKVSCHAFFRLDDPKVVVQSGVSGNIPQFFLEHMNHKGTKLTEEFSKVISAFRPDTPADRDIISNPKQGFVAIKLDIFQVIGLMLSYEPNTHRINISQVSEINDTIVITAFKTLITKGRARKGKRDKFSQML